MIIKSDFKDYYDYIGHMYGQDPLAIYLRLKQPGDKVEVSTYANGQLKKVERELDFYSIPFSKKLPLFHLPIAPYHFFKYEGKIIRIPELDRWSVRTIYICGRAFAVMEHPDTPAHAFNNDSPLHAVLAKHKAIKTIETLQPFESDVIEALHRLTKQPIIEPLYPVMGQDDIVRITCRPPKLGELRFAKIYPAEQIWQDLSYWIINKIHDSPDMMPPPQPPRTDLEKLEAHGFDKRVSFRHRT